jgi:hypothetical protein
VSIADQTFRWEQHRLQCGNLKKPASPEELMTRLAMYAAISTAKLVIAPAPGKDSRQISHQ